MQSFDRNRKASKSQSTPVQRVVQSVKGIVDNRPQAVLQRKLQQMASSSPRVIQAKVSGGGLPPDLKAGIEAMSGYSLDNVKVHYNSIKPAELGAHAYAQGNDIYIAPGQEKHLAHEAWHVVQQRQGRVRPTMQLEGGIAINDNVSLEQEADRMGQRASFPLAGHATATNSYDHTTSSVIQMATPWTLEGAFSIMRNTDMGIDTLMKIQKYKIAIHHQNKKGEYTKQIVANGRIEPKATPSGMKGFGMKSKVYIAGDISDEEAAAMIVHEVSHSVQWQKGELIEKERSALPAANPTFSKEDVDKIVELKMEIDAHLNQFEFEIEAGCQSDDCKACVDGSGNLVESKVVDLIKTRYGLDSPPPGSLEDQANKANKPLKVTMLTNFKADNKEVYDSDKQKALLINLQSTKPISATDKTARDKRLKNKPARIITI